MNGFCPNCEKETTLKNIKRVEDFNVRGETIPVEVEYFQCQECGECILNETGGICPVTKCAKGLLNGSCGGAENGKCEVDSVRDCAWILIYNRMAALGELDKLRRFMVPKDYSKMAKPRILKIKEKKVA